MFIEVTTQRLDKDNIPIGKPFELMINADFIDNIMKITEEEKKERCIPPNFNACLITRYGCDEQMVYYTFNTYEELKNKLKSI
jgi:hypothetical protein